MKTAQTVVKSQGAAYGPESHASIAGKAAILARIFICRSGIILGQWGQWGQWKSTKNKFWPIRTSFQRQIQWCHVFYRYETFSPMKMHRIRICTDPDQFSATNPILTRIVSLRNFLTNENATKSYLYPFGPLLSEKYNSATCFIVTELLTTI